MFKDTFPKSSRQPVIPFVSATCEENAVDVPFVADVGVNAPTLLTVVSMVREAVEDQELAGGTLHAESSYALTL
jgi:hypothetical protein